MNKIKACYLKVVKTNSIDNLKHLKRISNHFTFFVVFFFFIEFKAQIISLTVVDSIQKTPLFGATVSHSKKTITLTDNKGKFELNAKDFSSCDTLFIDYLGYQTQKIAINDLPAIKTIYMFEKFFSLDEVVLRGLTKKEEIEIIKDIISKYQQTFNKDMFLAELNFKQIMSYNFQPKGYFEFDGKLIMPAIDGKENTEPFYWIKEFRRTTEDIDFNIFSHKNETEKHLYLSFVRTTFLNYISYIFHHPFSDKGNNKYQIQIESTETINGIDYYKLQFKQIKNLEWVNRNLYDIVGVIYVNKNTLEISKESISYNWDHLSFSKFDIKYSNHPDGSIFLSTIYSNILSLKNNRKIMSESLCTVKKITHKKLVRTFENGYYLKLIAVKELELQKYHVEYWKNQSLENSLFYDKLKLIIGTMSIENAFEIGSEETYLLNPKILENTSFKDAEIWFDGVKEYFE